MTPLTVQTLGELEVTEVVPSPVVLTVAAKLPPYVASVGGSLTVGVLGGSPTLKDGPVTKVRLPSLSVTWIRV
ncbi:MAG TPA: hypothetical protein VIJ60_05760 [Acidimicrobiales bacterium]